jgi:hypothetical protein
MRVFLSIVSACVFAALLFASTGLGDPPVAATLTPPPPPFETCKTVGGGTICQGTVDESYGPVDTGLVCDSGGGAFGISDSADHHELARRQYDSNGRLRERIRYDRFGGRLSNATTGATLPYTQMQVTTDELGVPGDFGSARTTVTGEIIFKPASAAPVLIGAGRVAVAPDGSIEFEAGPSGFVDLVAGADAALIALCSALATA